MYPVSKNRIPNAHIRLQNRMRISAFGFLKTEYRMSHSDVYNSDSNTDPACFHDRSRSDRPFSFQRTSPAVDFLYFFLDFCPIFFTQIRCILNKKKGACQRGLNSLAPGSWALFSGIDKIIHGESLSHTP